MGQGTMFMWCNLFATGLVVLYLLVTILLDVCNPDIRKYSDRT